MSGLRVCYVCSRYPAVSHTFIQREVQALRRAGLDVSTVAVKRAEPADLLSCDDETEFAGTRFIRPITTWRLAQILFATFAKHPVAFVRTLLATLRTGRTDLREITWRLFYFAEGVVLWRQCSEHGERHLHAHFANVACDVARVAWRLGNEIDPQQQWTWSFTMHGPTEFSDETVYGLAGKTRDADMVVCITDYARAQLMRLLETDQWDKLHVVHCGLDLPRFRFEDRAPGTPFRILCIGRLASMKGHDLLVTAVSLLRDRGIDAELTIIGEGSGRGSLEARIAELRLQSAVHLLGALGQDEIPGQLSSHQVFCLASSQEGLPVVLMEAMAVGLPVVTTRITGVPELIEDGRTGILVAPGRADLLADGLEQIYRDATLARSLAVAARQTIEASFNIDCSAALLRSLFSTVGAARPAGHRGETT